MTAECRKYKADAGLILKSQGLKTPLSGLALIHYHFFWPDNRRRDTDNYLKVLKDCLTGALYDDDGSLAGDTE
jgi:Holliday junction resolvase RusA-like endonuclease